MDEDLVWEKVFEQRNCNIKVDKHKSAVDNMYADSTIKAVRYDIDDKPYAFYKRRTSVFLSIYDLMLKSWTSHVDDNMFGVDFELYSTERDLKAGTNKWKYCDSAAPNGRPVGFPGRCGTYGETSYKWAAHSCGAQRTVSFYIARVKGDTNPITARSMNAD